MKRKLMYVFLIGLLGYFVVCGLVVNYVTSPASKEIPSAQSVFEFPAEDIQLTTNDNVKIAAWYIPNENKGNSVILLNGIRGNRNGMVKHVKYYQNRGFAVLALDLRGTGMSSPEPISFGWKEAKDVEAALAFLQVEKYDKIIGHGLSLGAAAITYTLEENHPFDAFVFESLYDNIGQALSNRIWPSWAGFGMVWCAEWMLGIDDKDLAPIKQGQYIHEPILYLAGEKETRVRPAETQQIFDACFSEQKHLYFFKEAKHVNFYQHYEDNYEYVLNKFYDKHGF